MTLSGAPPGTELQYRVWYHNVTMHTDPPNGGWASAGTIVGTMTHRHPLVSIEVRLVNAPLHCHVRYMVHRRKGLLFQNNGGGYPLEWSYDGAEAGAHNFPYYRIEAMKAEIVSF